ncbi:hypothetical protein C1H46_008600 [Malus baccata]|uniref:Uncharacterized protein n=1 Tax=Malus baccata TaxID=106549 RepID=A0A540N3Z7_MALBA|nr:hypothetical protein C1H46_008600 [Malus baccata]
MIERHLSPKVEVEDGCFIIDKVFDDELLIYPEDIKSSMRKDVMMYFPYVVNMEKENLENLEVGQRVEEKAQDDEGWMAMIP